MHTKQKYEHTEGDSDTDTDIEPSKTSSKQKTSSADRPKSPNGEFKTIEFGLKKRHSSHTYACQECRKRKQNTTELNKHYKHNHKPVLCRICNQLFALTSTLAKHMYIHLDKSFTCESRGMQFSFASQLEYHKSVHKKIATHICMFLKCNKSFMHKGDLFEELKYPCLQCDKHFKWQQQLKRHQETDH